MEPGTKIGKLLGAVLSVAIVAAALALGLVVIYHTNHYPRTDDSEILANFIGMANVWEGTGTKPSTAKGDYSVECAVGTVKVAAANVDVEDSDEQVCVVARPDQIRVREA